MGHPALFLSNRQQYFSVQQQAKAVALFSGLCYTFFRRPGSWRKEFAQSGIRESSGNIIFPSGNAARYLSKYFREEELPPNPYEEDPRDVRAICISPNGDVLGGNIYRTDIMELIDAYRPAE